MDVEYFPFDEQTCVMKFGSWTYDGFQVSNMLQNIYLLIFVNEELVVEMTFLHSTDNEDEISLQWCRNDFSLSVNCNGRMDVLEPISILVNQIVVFANH